MGLGFIFFPLWAFFPCSWRDCVSWTQATRWVGLELYVFTKNISTGAQYVAQQKRIGWRKVKTLPLCVSKIVLAQHFFFHRMHAEAEFFLGRGRNFAKFQPENIWFRPMQRIFHGKHGPNSPDFNQKKL